MIIKQFTIEALDKYKLFYVLDTISNTDVTLYRRTPAGDELFDNAAIFIMNDGHLVVAIHDPYVYSSNACLIAKSQNIEEIVNLIAWERIVDIYDTNIDNIDQGVFMFIGSKIIADPSAEWRCDNTLYGGVGFDKDLTSVVVTKLDDIIAYEVLLSVHNVGYLVYIHMKNDELVREERKNNSVIPACGLTLSEAFKVMQEWAEVAEPPFNNTDPIALAAKEFLHTFGFTPDLVDNQVDMQVVNYLKGNSKARLRPAGVQPNKPELITFVKKHMASSSLASLCKMYPSMWNINEILIAEQQSLDAGVVRFRNYWNIPDEYDMSDWARIKEHCKANFGAFYLEAAVHNQLRILTNKQTILDELSQVDKQ